MRIEDKIELSEYWCFFLFHPFGHFFLSFPLFEVKCFLTDISGPRSHFTPIKTISFEENKIYQNCFLRGKYFNKVYCSLYVRIVELFQFNLLLTSRRKLFRFFIIILSFPLKIHSFRSVLLSINICWIFLSLSIPLSVKKVITSSIITPFLFISFPMRNTITLKICRTYSEKNTFPNKNIQNWLEATLSKEIMISLN